VLIKNYFLLRSENRRSVRWTKLHLWSQIFNHLQRQRDDPKDFSYGMCFFVVWTRC